MLKFMRSLKKPVTAIAERVLNFDSPVPDSRHLVLEGLDLPSKTVLEIGPLNRPLVPRSGARQVFYMDHCSAVALRAKYLSNPAINVAEIQEIDFVAEDGRIASNVGGQKFDVVVASHVIEHTPDLIGWLEEASSVLTDGGVLALTIPDKRYTFDVCRRLSPFPVIEAAYKARRDRPYIWNIIDHFANVVQVNSDDLWRDPDAALRALPLHTADHVDTAIRHWRGGYYVDCHSWVFTPEHFRNIVRWAAETHGLPLVEKHFADTMFRNIEFYIQLQRRG